MHKANVAGWADMQGLTGLRARVEELEARSTADGGTLEAALMALR